MEDPVADISPDGFLTSRNQVVSDVVSEATVMSIVFAFAREPAVRLAYAASLRLQRSGRLRRAYRIDRALRTVFRALGHGQLPEIVWAGEMYPGRMATIEIEGRLYAEELVKLKNAGVVRIGDGVRIRQGTVISNHGSGALEIGRNTNIGESVTILTRGDITIGHDVMVGPGSKIIAESHGTKPDSGPFISQPQTSADITIGNNVWLGANSVVLDGVTIGESCIVAAGSVVMRNVPPFSIVAGSPGRVVRSLLVSPPADAS